jgi:predicted RNase H-like HicB family nuclease
MIKYSREIDGRWIAEDTEHPGVLAYGATKSEARERAKRIAEVAKRWAKEKLKTKKEASS